MLPLLLIGWLNLLCAPLLGASAADQASVPAAVQAATEIQAPVTAPVAVPPAASAGETDSVAPRLDIGQVEKQMEAVDALGLEEAIANGLKADYQAAIKKLKEAAESRKKSAAFHTAIRSAPLQTVEFERQFEALPSIDEASKVASSPDIDALRKQVESRRTALADLEQRLESVERERSYVKGRPAEIATRLPKARDELAEVVAKLAVTEPAASASPGRVAARTLLEARQEALEAEVAMLLQEEQSQVSRENRLRAQRDLLVRQRENDRVTLAALEEQLQHDLTNQARQLNERVERLVAQATSNGGEVAAHLDEWRKLSDQLRKSAEQIHEVAAKQEQLTDQFEGLEDNYKRIRQEVKIGGLEDSFAQVLLEQRRQLPNPRPITYSIKTMGATLREARLAAFRVDEELGRRLKLDDHSSENADSSRAGLVAVRTELLEELRKNYRTLVRGLSRLDTDERAYRDLIIEVRGFLSDSLFWHRTSPPFGVDSLKDIPDALKWAFGIERWREGWRVLTGIPTRYPLRSLFLVVAVVALQTMRPRTKRSLLESGRKIRRISTDRYSYTLLALLDTLLLAAPIPMVLGFMAWGLLHDPRGSEWVRGLGHGMGEVALFLAWTLTIRESCRCGGLGIAHFGWHERSAARLRSGLMWLFIVYVPALLVISVTMFDETGRYFDSLGRICFVISSIWIALVLAKLFRPSDGILVEMIEEHPGRLFARTRFLWFSLLVACPLFFAVIAGIGYALPAITVAHGYLRTLGVLASGMLLYGMVLRWFMIKERRLALEEALNKRRAQREAAGRPVEATGDVICTDDETLELDLASIGMQTRRLLRSLIGMAVVVAIWFLWLRTLPLDGVLDERSSKTGLHLFTLVQAALVIGITVTVVRNLHGLLDLAGLRNSGLDSGTRFAVAAIGQYLVIAIAVVVVFRILRIDGSQFSWIAAALSVGLGFGLQEIVANFVCGIILLFERPIRVGDVITVAHVTGTVTTIRMRATTITNWDRQEFVVPNKEFITGSIINWTLTNPINRVIIPVGVAYGSDTQKARDILLEVAGDHSRIMKEPAPVAAFEAFADSTLNLSLRCYLPDMDGRLRTITELHSSIDERFKEAGIEIAFPQQDLHLRSIDPAVSFAQNRVPPSGSK